MSEKLAFLFILIFTVAFLLVRMLIAGCTVRERRNRFNINKESKVLVACTEQLKSINAVLGPRGSAVDMRVRFVEQAIEVGKKANTRYPELDAIYLEQLKKKMDWLGIHRR